VTILLDGEPVEAFEDVGGLAALAAVLAHV
jgi:hypothetical protein